MSDNQPPQSQGQPKPPLQQNSQQQQQVQSQQTSQQQPQAPPQQQQVPPQLQQTPPQLQQTPPQLQQTPPQQQQVQPQQQVHPQQHSQQQQQHHPQHHGQQQQAVQQQHQQAVAPQQIQQAIPQQQQQQQIQQLQHIQPQQVQQQHHVMGNMQPQTMTSGPLSMGLAATPQNPVMTGTASIRPQLSQLPQVQVIHQAMHSPPYLPQFTYNQQQLMLQNMQAAMAGGMGMNPQFNMANMAVAMQGRPGTNMFTPVGTVAASPTTPTTPLNPNASSATNTQITTTITAAQNQAKPAVANGNKQQQQQLQQQQQQQQQQQIHAQIGQVQQAPATAMIGGKPIILGQTTGQPMLSGQIGVISASQLPTSQAYGATGQAYGQIQSKSGQQLGVANTQQGQAQLMTSQAPVRFSQPQLVSNAGQLISSQPVISNQVLQAMASLQQQQYPGQMMSAPGQSPTIITGQGLYIRPANSVQAQGLMANVQAAINPNYKPTQQAVQNQSLPIHKQATAAQTGKVLLPSATKVSTAKVAPTSNVSAMAKSGAPGVAGKPKGRPKGSGTRPFSTSVVTAFTKSESISSVSKPSTPTIQTAALATPTDTKSQSDSELEVAKKPPTNNVAAQLTNENVEQKPDVEEKPMDHNEVDKDNEKVRESLPTAIIEQPVEKQRAIVKPHILTHVIEGFVIQEGPEPFAVQRSSLLTEFIPPKPGQPVEQSSLISMDDDDLDQEDEESNNSPGALNEGDSTLTCECCGRVELVSKFQRSQRFCSTTCVKRYNVGCSKRLGLFAGKPKEKGAGGRVLKRKRHTKTRKDGRSFSTGSTSHGLDNEMDEQSSSVSGREESVSPATTPDHRLHTPPPDIHMETDHTPLTSPSKWNVQDVYDFIRSFPGCSPYAEEFRSQEIDGQALLLLKEDHLMTAMNMKLGPALKICAKINAIKEETG